MKSRLLIVDDSLAIHDDYARVFGFGPEAAKREDFEKLERLLFGDTEAQEPQDEECFEVDRALQGEQALEMVEKAMVEARPYSVVFMDRFMPPGWDGIRTAREVWEKAPDTQIVLVSAFADAFHNARSYFKGKRNHQLLYLRKPFDGEIIRHLAICLVEKWRQAKKLKSLLAKSQAIELPQKDDVADRDEHGFLEFLHLANDMAQPLLMAFHRGEGDVLGRIGNEIIKGASNVAVNPLVVCAQRLCSIVGNGKMEPVGDVLQVYLEHLGLLKQAWVRS